MTKPDFVRAVWVNTSYPKNDKSYYTVVYTNGRYCSMNECPLDNLNGEIWSGRGWPLRQEFEEVIEWEALPPDCQEAVCIDICEQYEEERS